MFRWGPAGGRSTERVNHRHVRWKAWLRWRVRYIVGRVDGFLGGGQAFGPPARLGQPDGTVAESPAAADAWLETAALSTSDLCWHAFDQDLRRGHYELALDLDRRCCTWRSRGAQDR